MDAPDLTAHPLYIKAHPHCMRVVLKAGDTLFIPAYWHHEVQSVPDKEVGLNIAVNFWYKNLTAPPVAEYELLSGKGKRGGGGGE